MDGRSRRRHRSIERHIHRGITRGALTTVLVIALAPAAFAAGGDLDATFSGDGVAATNLTAKLDFAYDVAALHDNGAIVAAGTAAGSGGRIALARYGPDGLPDDSFGGGDGKVLTDLTTGDDYAFSIVIEPSDQQIVVAGGGGGSGERFMLTRYDANGSVDGTFGDDGSVFTNFSRRYDYVDALAIQDDGKLVAVGSSNYYGSTPRFALARYDTEGSLDATFSGDGKLITAFAEGTAWGFGVAIQADGKIVAGGQAGSKMALARYSSDGQLDDTFAGDGRSTTNFTKGTDYIDEVMIQADGRIVAVGSADFYGTDPRFAVVRYEAVGGLDSSFGGDGKVTTNPSRSIDWALGAVLQPAGGKIVVAGRTGGSGGRFVVARYDVA